MKKLVERFGFQEVEVGVFKLELDTCGLELYALGKKYILRIEDWRVTWKSFSNLSALNAYITSLEGEDE